MNTTKTITEDEFDELYQPLVGESGHYRFETYWAEPELGFLKKMDEHHLWTQVEEGEETFFFPGWHHENAIAMLMSMKPWTAEDRAAGLHVICEDPYDEVTYEGRDEEVDAG